MSKRAMLIIHLDFEETISETDAYTLILSKFTNMVREKELVSYELEEWHGNAWEEEWNGN